MNDDCFSYNYVAAIKINHLSPAYNRNTNTGIHTIERQRLTTCKLVQPVHSRQIIVIKYGLYFSLDQI